MIGWRYIWQLMMLYVEQRLLFLFEMEAINVGRLEMLLATEEVVSSIELIMPLEGLQSIFCPRISTFSCITIESISCGVLIIPSSSRCVVKNCDSTFLFEMAIINASWLEMLLAIEEVAS